MSEMFKCVADYADQQMRDAIAEIMGQEVTANQLNRAFGPRGGQTEETKS